MRKSLLIVSLVSTVLYGCNGARVEGPATGKGAGQLSLKPGESFSGAQQCGVDKAACPAGLDCVVIELEGLNDALCVDAQAVCKKLNCSSGECVMQESFPGRIVCERR